MSQEELAEWRAAIDQVVYNTDIDRNEFPLNTKPTIIHGLNTAVRVNNAEANTLMAMCHLKLKLAPSLGDFFEASAEKGMKLLVRAKDKGYAPAIYQLSECYRLGIGVQQDSKKSLELCRKAADEPHNFPAAQRQLGIAYFDGLGVDKDYHEATRWFQQATQRNDVEAVVRLGLCYQNGLGGLEQSSKHAVDLFQVAALKRHPFANSALGRAYDRGEGYRWNPEKALHYYEIGANAGDHMGCIGAAWLLLSGGDGHVEKNVKKAVDYLTLAAKGGSPEAQYLLGQLYLVPHLGGEIDNRKGMEMITKAADGGIFKANYMLGQAYQMGLYGCSEDLKKALENYEKAAAKGHDVSKMRTVAIRKQLAETEDDDDEEGGKKGGKKKKK